MDKELSVGVKALQARIEYLERELDAARSMQSQKAQGQAAAWQFYQDGKWYTGMNTNNHRENTEEAGYPVRDLYAHPPAPVAAPKGANKYGLDARYFHQQLSMILRDIDSYAPDGMMRALAKLALIASPAPTDKDHQQAALFRAHNGGED